MPIFACEQCECVENTATSNYWWRKSKGQPLLCSECDPDPGKWHGVFPKRPAAGLLVDDQGHLWGSAESVPPSRRIIGPYRPTATEQNKPADGGEGK